MFEYSVADFETKEAAQKAVELLENNGFTSWISEGDKISVIILGWLSDLHEALVVISDLDFE